MTVTYCGTCGTANGVAAKFCRHCGAELSAQNPLTVSPVTTAQARQAQLRIVTPEAEIIPLAPAVNVIELPPQLVEENQHASESLRRLREAQIIEARQEEEARQYKQAVSQRLSQRLASTQQSVQQSAQQRAPAQKNARAAVATSALEAPQAQPTPPETKVDIPLVTPKQLKNPPVPIRSQQADPDKTDFKTPERNPERRNAERNDARGALSSSSVLNPASAMQQVEAQNRSGFAARLAASMLGIGLLFGGFYAYRHQVFSGNLISGVRNLLSPEEQSAQLLQASRSDLEAGKVEEATQKLERAVELTPSEPITHEQLADAYVQRGRTEEALRTLDGLLKLAPEHLDARLKLAALQRRQGNLSEARAQYQKIINLDHESQQAAQALDAIEALDATLNATTLAANNGETARQRRQSGLKRVGPVLPMAATARPPVTVLGQTPLGVPATNNYFDWSPRRSLEAPDPGTVAAMHKNTGIRYYNIREYGAALRELQQATHLTPNDKEIYYFLGGTYRGLGQPLKAFDSYKRCDSGTYAEVAQSGAKQTEKAARKAYQQAQEQQYKSAPSTEAVKEAPRNNALQNLSAPIIAPFGGRAAFNPTPQQ